MNENLKKIKTIENKTRINKINKIQETERQIYSGKNRVFENYNRLLKSNSNISLSNKELIQKWQNSLFAKDTKQYRVGKLTCQIMQILHLADYKDLDSFNIDSLTNILAKINQSDKWQDVTKADFKRTLKQFFLWFEDNDKNSTSEERIKFYRHIRKNLNTAYKLKIMDYSSIISESDISILISKGCNNSRDKAFITMLHEGGFRIGEILNIKIKDLEFKNNSCIVQVDGKTGRRRVPLKILSVGYIYRWLQEHPFKDNPNAYLWTCLSSNCKDKYINHRGASKICDSVFDKANINKKHNPHWFRHSRATINAKFMTESMLCNYFGWVPGSNQVRTYTHTDTKQVEEVLDKHYGLVSKEETKPSFILCNICETHNSPESQFCSRCGHPLNIKASDEKENHMSFAFKVMQEIIKNPEYMQKFNEFKQNQT